MGIPEKKYLSPEAYLEMEATSLEKHEYYDGEIFALAGATITHNLIVSNTSGEIYSKLKNKNCKSFTSDLRIHIKSNGLYTYPDISVVCGKIEKADTPFDSVTNPVMIIEVLSETTKDYDRGSKFMLYRGLPSLKEYILIDSTGATHIEQFVKNEEDIWQLHEYQNMDDSVKIKSLDINIPLSDIYKDVYEQA